MEWVGDFSEWMGFRPLSLHVYMFYLFYILVVWLNGNDVGHINKVALRWARLVLGWVTVSGFNSRSRKFISV